jgi:4-diphosphocytidyl-2-C-methyl-D-erythritol kinase
VIVFPNCKINLGLQVLGRRPDGYHNIRSVFYPLPFRDVLEIIPSETFGFSISGLPVPGIPSENLCIKAYHLLKSRLPGLPPVRIWLHKHIPMGAGLGGGSADAAFLLAAINSQFGLGLSEGELCEDALKLGSDCPFFVVNRPCLAEGRGEELKIVNLDLSPYSFMLVHPGIPISTSQAFAAISPSTPGEDLLDIVQQPLSSWRDRLINDFEEPAFKKYPWLQGIREKLYASGALYASMTGSGSSFFGIFEKHTLPSISFDREIKVDTIK